MLNFDAWWFPVMTTHAGSCELQKLQTWRQMESSQLQTVVLLYQKLHSWRKRYFELHLDWHCEVHFECRFECYVNVDLVYSRLHEGQYINVFSSVWAPMAGQFERQFGCQFECQFEGQFGIKWRSIQGVVGSIPKITNCKDRDCATFNVLNIHPLQ